MKITKINEITKEKLLEMIEDRGLKIVDVYEVKQPGFISPYKLVPSYDEALQDDIRVFKLEVICNELMILNEDEINHINKHGYLKC